MRLHGAELAATHVFRLFNHVLPIDVVHPRTGRDAAQPLGLGLAPAEDVAVVEVVGHGGLLRP
jgi:hypothetical protein